MLTEREIQTLLGMLARLAQVILTEFPDEPVSTGGQIDAAIRIMRERSLDAQMWKRRSAALETECADLRAAVSRAQACLRSVPKRGPWRDRTSERRQGVD